MSIEINDASFRFCESLCFLFLREKQLWRSERCIFAFASVVVCLLLVLKTYRMRTENLTRHGCACIKMKKRKKPRKKEKRSYAQHGYIKMLLYNYVLHSIEGVIFRHNKLLAWTQPRLPALPDMDVHASK